MSAARAWTARSLDALLLRPEERRARERSPGRMATIGRAYRAAVRREDAARALGDPGEAVAAIALYREAALLLITAIDGCATSPKDERLMPSEAWSRLDALGSTLPKATPCVAAARVVLASDDPLVADALGAKALAEARRASADTVEWLRGQVDPRTVRQILVARAARIGLTLVAAAAMTWWMATPASRNVARGKPAQASSALPGTTAGGVTDGIIQASYGVATEREENPWVMVDLGDVLPLAEVRVINRGDGWLEESLPLVLEVSSSGDAFEEVDRRTLLFTQTDPWKAAPGGRRARWVRVRHPGYGYIALSEIEVYASAR